MVANKIKYINEKLIYLLLFFVSCNSIENELCESDYNKTFVKPLLIEGRIIDIYTPELHHGAKVIKVKNYDGNIILYEQSYRIDQNLYEETNTGDSILKRKGFLDIIITKPNNVKKIYYFNCPNIIHDSIW